MSSSHPRPLIAAAPRFRSALRRWYRAHARSLPWRDSPDLYGTVVSEFMLQQTQVATVLPYFERWLAAFPDFASLAKAPAARVLRLWEGLGYYSRARNLHRLAKAVAARRAPPRTPEEWRALPGVGPYTAAAITSIAFGAREACVDGNVVRVLARLTADGSEFRDTSTAARHFAPLAGSLLCPANPGDHNQAMMELGATVCLRRRPRCAICPVRGFCTAATRDDPEAFPCLARKPSTRLSILRVWCERGGALLLHRVDAGSRRLGGLHELPEARLAAVPKARARRGELLALRHRGISSHRIVESIHRAAAPRRKLSGDLVWIPFGRLGSITLSGPHRRWIAEILARSGRASR